MLRKGALEMGFRRLPNIKLCIPARSAIPSIIFLVVFLSAS
jgi:hypothetical protein